MDMRASFHCICMYRHPVTVSKIHLKCIKSLPVILIAVKSKQLWIIPNPHLTFVTWPAKIDHLSTKNCQVCWSLIYHNLITIYTTATKSSALLQNLMGFHLKLMEIALWMEDISKNITQVICTFIFDFCSPGHICSAHGIEIYYIREVYLLEY